MDLFLREATERIGADDALSKIDALMDWPSFSPILERGLGRSGVGPQVHGIDAPESRQLCRRNSGDERRCGQQAALVRPTGSVAVR